MTYNGRHWIVFIDLHQRNLKLFCYFSFIDESKVIKGLSSKCHTNNIYAHIHTNIHIYIIK